LSKSYHSQGPLL